jgi:hypothetical protein
MNRKLLREIIADIEREPLAFDMGRWFQKTRQTECGSVGCIAGKAVWLTDPKRLTGRKWYLHDWFREAQAALRLSEDEATRLFYYSSWPDKFSFYGIETPEASAQVTVKRIKHFMRTNGTDIPKSKSA